MSKMFCAALAALMVAAAPAYGQRNDVSLEASFVSGAISWSRELQPGRRAGLVFGAGIPQLDITVVPAQDSLGQPDFEELLHVGAFLRLTPSRNFDVELGVRGSIANLFSCQVSDCWPAAFVGVYAQPMIGWQRLKFGARMVAGGITESESGGGGGTGVIAINPFIVRYVHPLR